MQLDMHYYGTYAMARAAGLDAKTAGMSATCAQFVDDNTADKNLSLEDGSFVDAERTAHHPFAAAKSSLIARLGPYFGFGKYTAEMREIDQRRIWVPFHFLPGAEGEGYTERFKCRKDSIIAREMIDHHIDHYAFRAFAPALMGVAAHVYADTFSHYGFSGVSSRGNAVNNESFKFHEEMEDMGGAVIPLDPEMRRYIIRKAQKFFNLPKSKIGIGLRNIRKSVTSIGEKASGALGHGAVATYPDRPYLIWSFEYERSDDVEGVKSSRNNLKRYLEGCEALHRMFSRFAGVRDDLSAGDRREFASIKDAVKDVLSQQKPKAGRIDAWRAAAQAGAIFGHAGEQIPDYEGLSWNEEWAALDGAKSMKAVEESPVWRFYQAASIHRAYVLRDLLPRYGLIVG